MSHNDTARAILRALDEGGYMHVSPLDGEPNESAMLALVVGVLEAQESRTVPAWHGRTMPTIGRDEPLLTVDEYVSASTPADYFQRLTEALHGIPVVTVDGLDGAHAVRPEDIAKALHDMVNAPLVSGGRFAPDISGGREEGDDWVQFYGKGGGPSVLMSTKLEDFLRSQPVAKPDTTIADWFLRGQTTPVGVALAATDEPIDEWVPAPPHVGQFRWERLQGGRLRAACERHYSMDLPHRTYFTWRTYEPSGAQRDHGDAPTWDEMADQVQYDLVGRERGDPAPRAIFGTEPVSHAVFVATGGLVLQDAEVVDHGDGTATVYPHGVPTDDGEGT